MEGAETSVSLADLNRIIASGESETLELKKSTAELGRAGESLCGFLNGQGGRVVIGVSPGGRLVGQEVSDKTLQDVAAMLRRFEPPAPVEFARVPLPESGLALLVFAAAPTQDALPFTYDGRPYQRIGTTTSVMPQERYQDLLLRRVHSRRRWENEVADVPQAELDAEEILRTSRLGVAAGRLPEATGLDPSDILERLGLKPGGRLTNAAAVLFATSFLPDYPQCGLRLARFKGVDKTEFLDNRQLHGHAFTLLDEAMLFLRRHLPVAGRIEPGLFERVDEPLFPLAALREALVNALCHRDYSIAGGAVSLALYDDRLEIWSDGTLPFGLRPEDLKRDHASRPRNPLIAEVFYRRGLVERWGRGTQKIVELCVKAGHPEPEFVEQAGAVGVRFPVGGYHPPLRIAHDLTERQREILQILASAPRLAFRVIASRVSSRPADRTLRDDLAHLKRLGLVGSEGHGRGATWALAAVETERNRAE